MNKKFRIWNEATSSFECSFKESLPEHCQEIYGPPRGNLFQALDDILENENYVIQQFTGLLDKNGREIYEGDTVFSNDDEEVYPVEFYKGMFCVKYPNGTFGPLWEFPEVVVCGNIFKS